MVGKAFLAVQPDRSTVSQSDMQNHTVRQSVDTHSRSGTDRITDLCLAAAAAGLGYSLATYWGWDVSAVDRLLIVGGAVWVGLPLFRVASRPTPAATPAFGLGLLLIGAFTLPLVWLLQTGLPGWRVLVLWWQWAAVSAITLAVVFGRSGVAGGRSVLFPLLFLAFALPIPSIVDAPLKLRLQGVTTASSEFLLRLLGEDVSRPGGGFVLHLPGGDLGVEEACSGVRSVTALTAIAAFLAYLFRFGPVRGILLVALAIPVVIGVNVLRVVLSGLIQEHIGGRYIRDEWHEGLGLLMVLVGVAGVRAVTGALRHPRLQWSGERAGFATSATDSPRDPTSSAGHTPSRRWSIVTAVTLVTSCTMSAIFAAVELRTGPTAESPPDLTALPLTLGEWTGRDLPVPAHVANMLYPDTALHREYRNAIGRGIQVWVLYWGVPEQIRGYHHPDVCLPSAGAAPVSNGEVVLQPTGGGRLPVATRVIRGSGQNLYVLYWTQEGRHVWGEADEESARVGLKSGTRGLVDFLARRTGMREQVGDTRRLVVLVGSEGTSGFAQGEAEGFTRQLADEVYRLCPWASPPVGNK
jgi:EpsI family protein